MVSQSWSKEDISSEFNSCSNLGEMISHIEERFSKEGQLVCEIKVNNLLLENEDEKTFSKTCITEIKSISVGLSSLDEIVKEVCLAFVECIPSLEETSLQAADFFRHGNLGKAQNVFSALLEGSQWLVDTLMHVKGVESKNGNERFSTPMWKMVEKGFAKTIREVLLAYESKNYNLMADILEYEMTEVLGAWLAAMEKSGINIEEILISRENKKREGKTSKVNNEADSNITESTEEVPLRL